MEIMQNRYRIQDEVIHMAGTKETNYEILRVHLQKGRKEVITAHAEEFGYRNVNEFVKTAIVQLMERDLEKGLKPSPVVPILNEDEEERERRWIEQAMIERD